MPLRHIHNNLHILTGITHSGLALTDHGTALVIDTGIGQRSGRQILRALKSLGAQPSAILNTHAHGDHTGGNAYIVERTDAQVYVPIDDRVILERPGWGTACLFVGAEPIPEVAAPRFMPEACQVDVAVSEGTYQVDGYEVQVVALPGHTNSHCGYLIDGILFTGDALANDRELDVAKIAYMYSVTKQLATLDRLGQTRCQGYVLAHGGYHPDISHIVQTNRVRIHDTLDLLVDATTNDPREASDLVPAICEHYDMHPRHARDFLFLFSTLHAYLGHLQKSGRIEHFLENDRLYWRAI